MFELLTEQKQRTKKNEKKIREISLRHVAHTCYKYQYASTSLSNSCLSIFYSVYVRVCRLVLFFFLLVVFLSFLHRFSIFRYKLNSVIHRHTLTNIRCSMLLMCIKVCFVWLSLSISIALKCQASSSLFVVNISGKGFAVCPQNWDKLRPIRVNRKLWPGATIEYCFDSFKVSTLVGKHETELRK